MDRCLFCEAKFQKRQVGKGYKKVLLSRNLRFQGDSEVLLTTYDALKLLYGYEVIKEFATFDEHVLCCWIVIVY